MDKTPVTLLHEFLMKQGRTPDYNLVHNGVGTHNPLFIYEVAALGKSAVGRGKSKREAKHAAAKELFLLLNSDGTSSVAPLDEIVQSPYEDMLKENAVGALLDFCLAYALDSPEYQLTRDEGLPHAKLFGMKCTVSSFSTNAEARTKKQAKQNASHLMLQKLKVFANIFESNLLNNSQREPEKTTVSELVALTAAKHFEDEPKPIHTTPLGVKLAEFDKIIKQDIYICCDGMVKLKEGGAEMVKNFEDPLKEFSELMKQMDLYWMKFEMASEKSEIKFAFIEIPILNNTSFFGKGTNEDDALQNAAKEGLIWIATMIQ